jgi:hypothetical protein
VFRAAHSGLSRSASPLERGLDLAAILCHAEDRVIANDYTFSFAGQRYQIRREQVQAGHDASRSLSHGLLRHFLAGSTSLISG